MSIWPFCSSVPAARSALAWRAAAALLAVLLLGGQTRAPVIGPAASGVTAVQITPRPLQQLTRQVPDVVNKTLPDAQSTLSGANLPWREQALGTPGGARRVVRQAPGAGTRYLPSAPPTVVLYTQADTAAPVAGGRMPELIGMDCKTASGVLAGALPNIRLRLTLRSCDEGVFTGRVAAGRIQRQEPAPGSPIDSATVARAWIEPVGVKVPDVVSRPAREAVAQLTQAGLRGEAVGSTAIERWHVVQAQDPRAGNVVPPRTVVRLTLMSRYVVPPLVGRSCDDARRAVADAGLGTLRCEPQALPSNPPAGRIHRQQPAPGTVLTAPTQVLAWEQPVQVTVPDLLNLDESTALARLAALPLRADARGPAASQGRRVAQQDPPPRTLVAPNSTVRLVLDLSVPNLSGLDCAAAGARAGSHGFSTLDCKLRRADASRPLRRVFEQSPAAGTRMAQAAPLAATAAEPVRVPAVVGRGLNDALATLQRDTLQGRPDATQGDREVTRQQPAAGAEVAPGSTVTLTTQAFGKVPAVVGLALPQARAAVTQAGFKAQPDASDREADRRVTAQQPAADTRLARGQPVALTTQIVVTVPDVVKQRLPNAEARLAAAGLRAEPDRREQAADREVRGQSPAAQALVPAGSAIALQTVRLVAVPDLVGATCEAAEQRLAVLGLKRGRCDVDTAVPLVLGASRIDRQSVAATTMVDEGSAVDTRAKPPAWSAPVVIGGGAATTSLALWWLFTLVRPGKKDAPPAETPPAAATVPAKPPRPADARWRVQRDASPAVTLRIAPDPDDLRSADHPQARPGWPRLQWRADKSPPSVCSRGLPLIDGDDDEPRPR